MVDMHPHVLWAVDDGTQTMELLQQVVREGITDMIATPHSGHLLYDVSFDTVTKQVLFLQQVIERNNLPLTLHTGY